MGFLDFLVVVFSLYMCVCMYGFFYWAVVGQLLFFGWVDVGCCCGQGFFVGLFVFLRNACMR